MPEYVTRRTALTAVAATLAGCAGGGDDTPTPTPAPASTPSGNPAVGDVTQMGDLRLTSPAFEDGGPIPREHGYEAENTNPPLSVESVPSGAESLTLVVDDPDAVEPAGEVWLHWLVWNIPPDRTEIPAGWEPTAAVTGINDFGNRGYDGPAPPDGEHTYRFKLYALDSTLDLPESATKREVGEAMQGGRLAQTSLEGTYAP